MYLGECHLWPSHLQTDLAATSWGGTNLGALNGPCILRDFLTCLVQILSILVVVANYLQFLFSGVLFRFLMGVVCSASSAASAILFTLFQLSILLDTCIKY